MSSPLRSVSSRRLPPLPVGPRLPLPHNSNSNGRQTSTTSGSSNTTAASTSPTSSSINNMSGNGSTFTNELRAAMVGRTHERFANGVANTSNPSSNFHHHQHEPGIITTTATHHNSSNLLTATGKSCMTFANIRKTQSHNSLQNV